MLVVMDNIVFLIVLLVVKSFTTS